MSDRVKMIIAAILVMAVMFMGVLLGGCATHKQAQTIQRDVQALRTENAETQRLLARVDSIIALGAEEDSRLRGEIRTSVDELHRQIAMLLENYSELMVRLNECCQGREVIYVKPSPGAQTDSVRPPDTASLPAINCDSTYDKFFVMVRQQEYEEAITGFRGFLEHCPKHDNVPNAHYWIGESYYMLGKFVEAITEFEYLINEYKSSSNNDRALYKLARSHEELGHKDQAKVIYQQLVDDFPGTLSSEQARDRLKEL